MSLAIDCDICGLEIDDPAALLFSPPSQQGLCVKTHVCDSCYRLLWVGWLRRPVPPGACS